MQYYKIYIYFLYRTSPLKTERCYIKYLPINHKYYTYIYIFGTSIYHAIANGYAMKMKNQVLSVLKALRIFVHVQRNISLTQRSIITCCRIASVANFADKPNESKSLYTKG